MKIRNFVLAIAAIVIGFSAQAQTTTGEKIQSFADKYLKLSGYIQGGFEWNEANNPEATFYLKRARVSLSGNAAQEKIDYRLQVDMAGSPKICDLYFRYKPLNELSMQLGQFKVPFAIENELCADQAVSRPAVQYALTAHKYVTSVSSSSRTNVVTSKSLTFVHDVL